jgi:integrase
MGRSGASELVFEDAGDLLLRAGTPVKVVSEGLGHSSPNITLSVYAHVMPGMQREVADTFAALVSGG